MASRRDIKREINGQLLGIIDEAYDFLIENKGDKEKEANAVIDASVELLNEFSAGVAAYRTLDKGKKAKSHFTDLKADILKKADALQKKVAGL